MTSSIRQSVVPSFMFVRLVVSEELKCVKRHNAHRQNSASYFRWKTCYCELDNL